VPSTADIFDDPDMAPASGAWRAIDGLERAGLQ
jgi:hypothetical protein